jgi:hypothetical protein
MYQHLPLQDHPKFTPILTFGLKTTNIWQPCFRPPGPLFRSADDDSTIDLRRRPPQRSTSFDDLLSGTLIEIRQQPPIYYTVDRRARCGLSIFILKTVSPKNLTTTHFFPKFCKFSSMYLKIIRAYLHTT